MARLTSMAESWVESHSVAFELVALLENLKPLSGESQPDDVLSALQAGAKLDDVWSKAVAVRQDRYRYDWLVTVAARRVTSCETVS